MATYKNIVEYMKSTGVPHRVTSTVRAPGTQTAAGNTSCHAADLTRCDAIDIAGMSTGRDTDDLARIFMAFSPVFPYMHELIYAGPQVNFNIKNGRKVAKYATAGHHDHIHAAILATTTLPMATPPAPTPAHPEDNTDMNGPSDLARAVVLNPNDPTSGYELDSWGGIHNIGKARPISSPFNQPGQNLAVDLVITRWGELDAVSGYILDRWGGTHSFGAAKPFPKAGHPYWPNNNVARRLIVLSDDPARGYILDMKGAMNPMGGAPALRGTPYWA